MTTWDAPFFSRTAINDDYYFKINRQYLLKNIVIFGSTGSIGVNALEVVSRFPDRFKVVGLSANNNYKLLAEQAEKFKVDSVNIGNKEHYSNLKSLLPATKTISAGQENFPELLECGENIDIVINAMVGSAGLLPTIKTLEKGITLALANKESLVAGGEIVISTAKQKGASIIPIDSEHSAVFQCLNGESGKSVAKIILTASGGPFVDTPLDEFSSITPDQALKHPNWNMGSRITIDSATMANKGFEVIEAKWLFDIEPENIEVTVHRQSIVHSMVRFIDGSYIAQMGMPDMRLPIQYALTYPERLESPYCNLDFTGKFHLDFRPVEGERFPCLGLAFRALKEGGTAPAVLNAADETAVEAFLRHEIEFTGIAKSIEAALNKIENIQNPDIDSVLRADKEARVFVETLLKG